jgi:glycosyltransferase involved in cell wall biosynthesis
VASDAPVISVVLPTLNEEEGIRKCIPIIKETLDGMGISYEIIVSDSSNDDTPRIAEELGLR